MNTAKLFVWDCKEIAPIKDIAKAVTKIKNAKLYQMDTGSTFYVLMVAKNKNDALKVWAKTVGKDIVENIMEDENINKNQAIKKCHADISYWKN